jgi:hypothetical protein
MRFLAAKVYPYFSVFTRFERVELGRNKPLLRQFLGLDGQAKRLLAHELHKGVEGVARL